MAQDVAVVVGSIRKESLNRKLAHAMAPLAPPGLSLAQVPIHDLPLYDPDLDGSPPGPWTAFRSRIKAVDAVLFVTPEYNRSIPAPMKNALDVGSRPYGASAWNGKPAAVVSASPGAVGGFGANHHLRQTLVFLNMPVLQQPEAYIGHADTLFDAEGKLVKEATRKFLGDLLTAFEIFIRKNHS